MVKCYYRAGEVIAEKQRSALALGPDHLLLRQVVARVPLAFARISYMLRGCPRRERQAPPHRSRPLSPSREGAPECSAASAACMRKRTFTKVPLVCFGYRGEFRRKLAVSARLAAASDARKVAKAIDRALSEC